MIRLSWVQPEDLLPHELVASAQEGKEVAEVAVRWSAAGGSLNAPVGGASDQPAPAGLRSLACRLLEELDELAPSAQLLADEPDDIDTLRALWSSTERDPRTTSVDATGPRHGAGKLDALYGRIHGAWLGRAVGCLLGKPVEKINREGIRAIAESTGRWPLRSYFTGIGLDPAVAGKYPWNKRSRTTSLIENIDGMPEDDDLNFPLIALSVLERHGRTFSTDDIAQAWLAGLPGGRVFTAERIVYRNLLLGYEPEVAGRIQNPFRDWIGAQIRTDLYGWVNPGDPVAAAELAWRDARLSHVRSGLYGALFVAGACSAALRVDAVGEVVEAGLSVIPPRSRYASAVRKAQELAASRLGDEEAIDELYREFGELHWVHVLNNTALSVFALLRSDGDFERAITTVVSGGWDTDSNGATVGSICGALAGADALPTRWIEPLHNRLETSIPGFAATGFDRLAERTLALVPGGGSV